MKKSHVDMETDRGIDGGRGDTATDPFGDVLKSRHSSVRLESSVVLRNQCDLFSYSPANSFPRQRGKEAQVGETAQILE